MDEQVKPRPNCLECSNWAGPVNNPYGIKTRNGWPIPTAHHPNCSHYNDSLMNVWRVSAGGSTCYVATEREADDIAVAECPDGAIVSVQKEKMHKEVFDNLPEFEGF